MYAIVEIGSKQYKVEKGSEIQIDLMQAKAGGKIKFNTVTLFRTDKDIHIGMPYVEKAVVEGKVIDPLIKGEKLDVFKYKQKASYRRKTGHRQKYTKIEVTGISLGTAKAKTAKTAEETEKNVNADAIDNAGKSE